MNLFDDKGVLYDPFKQPLPVASVARRLARMRRYAGNSISVARHSVIVSRSMLLNTADMKLAGLLHDIAEAVTGDIPEPLKEKMTIDGRSYSAWESSLRECMASDWGLDGLLFDAQEVAQADADVSAIERARIYHDLVSPSWTGYFGMDESEDEAVSAMRGFLSRYNELIYELGTKREER